jgi:hypothetical protein
MLRIGDSFLVLSDATGAGRAALPRNDVFETPVQATRWPARRLRSNCIPAMGAMRFSHRAERTADGLLESPQAIRAGDRNVRLSSSIIPISLNPEGCRAGLLVGRQLLHLGEPSDDSQQGPDTTALLVEGIGGNAGRHLIAGKCAAHRDYPNRGKTAVDHREQLKAGNTRHVEIGKKDIGYLVPDPNQCREPVFDRSNEKTNLNEHLRHQSSNSRLIIHDQQFLLGGSRLSRILHLLVECMKLLEPLSHRRIRFAGHFRTGVSGRAWER